MLELTTSASRCSYFPASIVLYTMAQIGRCENETTAQAKTTSGSPIDVSFVVVDPPGLSRIIVDCPDLRDVDPKAPPSVTGADGAFLLIRAFLIAPKSNGSFTNFFIYRAGPGKPSLRRLPEPYPLRLRRNNVAVLSCGDDSDHCFVVVPEWRGKAGLYHLDVLSTKTMLWSTKVAEVAGDMRYGRFRPTKVFSIGATSVAWVDFDLGILLCDELHTEPKMRLIPMPTLMPINKVAYRGDSLGNVPSLDPVRDIICRNDFFTCIEMEFLDSNESYTTPSEWRATIRKRKIESGNWEYCATVDSNLTPADSCLPNLFPEIYDCKENELTLKNVFSTFPILDLYRDDVVYVICKLKPDDPNGWVLAVNTESKKLENVHSFSAEKLYLLRIYLQCDFTKYISVAPGSCTSNGLKANISINQVGEQPKLSYVFATLFVQRILWHYEKHLTQRRPYDHEACSPNTGPALSLGHHIEPVSFVLLSGYATSYGVGKDAKHAIAVLTRASKNIDNSWDGPSACDKVTIDNIDAAVGALDKLLQTVPSEGLDKAKAMISFACADKESEILCCMTVTF